MTKLMALLALFRAGHEVADPGKWVRRQITATMLVPPLMAALDLSRAYGYDVPLDHDTIVTITVLIVMLVNLVLPIICNRQVGVSGGVGEASTTVSTAKSPVDIPEAGGNGGDPSKLPNKDEGGVTPGDSPRSEPPAGQAGGTFHYL